MRQRRYIDVRIHPGVRLVGGRRLEAAERGEGRFGEAQVQFLAQFAEQGVQRAFPGFSLASRQHEGAGAALAHQQQAALFVEQAGGGDIQGNGHGKSLRRGRSGAE
ncbi:hypothetical protein D3C78_1542040 [compost metagenome]